MGAHLIRLRQLVCINVVCEGMMVQRISSRLSGASSAYSFVLN